MTVFGTIWLWEQFQAFGRESDQIRQKYLKDHQLLLKEKVDDVVDYIEFKKSQTELRLREEIKFRTYEAYAVADHIYQKYRDTLPLDQIKKRVHDALYAVSWDNNSGYYFAEDMQGTELINRYNPELEGTNIWGIQDGKGNYIVQDIIRVAKSSAGEGFTRYYWNKRGHPELLVPKIVFVKYFEPFDWVIGNGKYVDEITTELQHEVLDRIDKIRFGKNNYIFAATYEGISLTGVFIGKEMLNVQDSNGVMIVQELIKAAKSDGGFVYYVMPKHKGMRPDPKLSYAKGIPDWEWYVGAGLYIDEIEELIAERQIEFQSQLMDIIIRIVGMLSVLLISFLLIGWWMFKKINVQLNIFGTFFQDAAVNAVKIDLDRLEYTEFRTLAENANEMIQLRQETASALAESEKRFLKVVELAPIPIVLTSLDGQMEYINKQYVQMFGYSREEIPDVRTWMELAYPDSIYREQVLKLWMEALQKTAENSDPFETGIIKVHTASGEFLDVKFYYTPVGDLGLTVAYNVTEMVQSEEERAILQQQLHQAQKMEAIGMMAGGVAHDLNNILSGIVSYPELLLLKLSENSELRSPLQNIHEAGLRAAEVVADLLTVARGVASEKKVVDINVMVDEYLCSPEFEKLKSRFPEVDVSFISGKDQLFLACSNTHVKKTIMNLVGNAAEAIQGNGRVQIETTCETLDRGMVLNHQTLKAGDYVTLCVSDDGPGINDNDLDHIFEPFYSKKVMGFSGTGLGLSIVWNTMLDHHGAVSVESSSEGSQFKLYFPASKSLSHIEKTVDVIEPLDGMGERILVVDDEAIQRDVAYQMLTSLRYNVDVAASGEEAIVMLKSNPVDLVILDMIMKPGMSGCETYEHISQMYPGQKALIVSGFTENDEVLRIQELGAGRYIKKPYTIRQLGKAIKEVLGGN